MAESSGRSENTCERFFWALQGVNYNVYGIVSATGDLVERYEYTPYGQRTVYSRGWLKCDLNGDGVVDSTDWDLYVYYRSHPQDGASIADYDGDGHVDMDGDGDRIDNQQGRSVADDPLVMYSRLESSRIDRQGWTAGGRGGYGSLCDIGHQGLLHDKEFGPASTGLVHNRARTLNPPLARFMQRDPKDSGRPRGGYHDGMSLYEYCRSEPVNGADPMGLRRAKHGTVLRSSGIGVKQKYESGMFYSKLLTVGFSWKKKENYSYYHIATITSNGCRSTDDRKTTPRYSYMKGESTTVGHAKSLTEGRKLSTEISSGIDSGGYKLGSKIGAEVSRSVTSSASVSTTNKSSRATSVGTEYTVECGKCYFYDVYQEAYTTRVEVHANWSYIHREAMSKTKRSTGQQKFVLINYDWTSKLVDDRVEGRCTRTGRCVRKKHKKLLYPGPEGLKGF